MKYIFLLVLSLFSCYLIAQTSVGVYNNTVTISPSNTVTNGTNIAASGFIENKGNIAITGNIHVHLGIDTSSTSTPKYYWRATTTYSVTNLLVGNTFSFTVTDVADVVNAYKGGGGGTTVVIWATVGAVTNSLTTADSAKTTVYLIGVPNGINNSLHFEESPIYFRNPSCDMILLNYDETIYTTVELIDENNKIIKNIVGEKSFSIYDFQKGLYLLKFWNKKKEIYITKKVIIE